MEKYKVSLRCNGHEEVLEIANIVETIKMLSLIAINGTEISNVTFYKTL